MLRRIIRLGLTALLVLGSGPAVTALSEDAEAEQALGEIVDQLNALEEWFSAAEKQTAAIEQQIKTQDQAIDRLGEQRRASETSLAAIRNSVAELEQEQNRLREDITAQRAAIVAHLQAAFRLSGDDFVKQILSQNSNADADRLMRYHGYFSEQRVAEMARFKGESHRTNGHGATPEPAAEKANRASPNLEGAISGTEGAATRSPQSDSSSGRSAQN